MTETASVWAECASCFTNVNDETEFLPTLPSTESLAWLQKTGKTSTLRLYLLTTLDSHIEKHVTSVLASTVSLSSTSQLMTNIELAHKHFIACLHLVQNFESTIPECQGVSRQFLLRAASQRATHIPPNFHASVYSVLRACQGERSIAAKICCQLVDLGLESIVEHAVSTVVFADIDALVKERTASGRLQQRALPALIRWVDDAVGTWVRELLPSTPNDQMDLLTEETEEGLELRKQKQMEQWRKRLSFRLHESVCSIRTAQLLHMIRSFPDSLPAVEDLKDCILSTDQKPFVTASLRQQFVEEVLNAGVVTADILHQYVNMIRMLKYLDHTGVILENVSGPVRAYLRRRPDTVRCIVSEMTGNGDLYEELQKGQGGKKIDRDGDVDMTIGNAITSAVRENDRKVKDHEDEDCLSIDGDFNADMKVNPADYDNWEPDPIDAPSKDSKRRSGGDAIATLVTIFGSSEQIVNEYKGVLADKLIASFDLDIQRESTILSLLTERFGSKAMHTCEIMLNDVKNSQKSLHYAKRLARRDAQRSQLDDFEVTVVSKVFWPSLGEEPSFKYPVTMEAQMKRFEEGFKEITRPRILEWQHGLGAVAMKLTFDDGREMEVNLSPMQAVMLWHFEQKKKIDVKELQQEMEVKDEGLFRRKLQGLVNQGIIRSTSPSSTVYETIEESASADTVAAPDDGEVDADAGEGDASVTMSEEDKQMAVYESYIMAMLQNLKQLSLDQIHSMLKRFVQTPVYDRTTAQLAAFLGKLVDDGKVEVRGGIYKVKTKK